MSILVGAMSGTLREANIGVVGDKVFVDRAPQGTTLPYIIINRTSTNRERNLASASGLVDATVDVSVYADGAEDREIIAEAIRNQFDGLINKTIGGTVIQELLIKSGSLLDQDDYTESPHDGSDRHVFVSTLDFRMIYTETVPTHA